MTKKEKEDNILYSCGDCGDKVYFKIKEMEHKDRDHVYVRFKRGSIVEKMWVRITNGTRSRGQGVLDNMPVKLSYLKLGDIIKFKTDDDGITWAKTG
jgi:uncharacterized protein YegJ (DUF2314 family)